MLNTIACNIDLVIVLLLSALINRKNTDCQIVDLKFLSLVPLLSANSLKTEF